MNCPKNGNNEKLLDIPSTEIGSVQSVEVEESTRHIWINKTRIPRLHISIQVADRRCKLKKRKLSLVG